MLNVMPNPLTSHRHHANGIAQGSPSPALDATNATIYPCADKLHALAKQLHGTVHNRLGSAYFSAAKTLDPRWALSFIYTVSDPFHNDSKIDEFVEKWIRDHHHLEKG